MNMMAKIRNACRPEPGAQRRGVVLVFSAVLGTVLIGFAALTIDLGMMQLIRAELQRTSDAAALAAVQDLSESDPTTTRLAAETALQFVKLNPVLNGKLARMDGERDFVFGKGHIDSATATVQFVPWAMPPNAVRVTTHFEYSYLLASVFGFSSVEIRATGLAAITPPLTVDVVPISLPVPGFGPVDPNVADHNPGKTGPSEPADGRVFQTGEEVAVFIFGMGPRPPVHLVLDINDGHGVAEINRLLATEEKLGGATEPFEVSIGDEYPVWNGGTGTATFGEKLQSRIDDFDPDNNTIIMPVVKELSDSRDEGGLLVNPIQIVDFAAVTLTEIRQVEVPDPTMLGKTMTILVMFGNVVELFSGSGDGTGTTSGIFTQGSVKAPPQLLM